MNRLPKPGIRIIGFILIVSLAAVLSAGCTDSVSASQKVTSSTDSQQTGQPENVSAAPVSVKTPVPFATGRIGTEQDRSAPFISIDPVGDKKIGDILVISGTTSLPEKIYLSLSRTLENSGNGEMMADRPILPGTNGTNRFRFVSDTTVFKPGLYTMTVATGKKEVSGSVQFSLTGTYLGTDNPIYYSGAPKGEGSTGTSYITVQPPGDQKRGDIIRVSGTTNLQAGTLLFYRVYPEYYEDRTKKPASLSDEVHMDNLGGDTIVIADTGGTNHWSFAMDTENYETMNYIVNVSTVNKDFTEQGIFGKSYFTIR